MIKLYHSFFAQRISSVWWWATLSWRWTALHAWWRSLPHSRRWTLSWWTIWSHTRWWALAWRSSHSRWSLSWRSTLTRSNATPTSRRVSTMACRALMRASSSFFESCVSSVTSCIAPYTFARPARRAHVCMRGCEMFRRESHTALHTSTPQPPAPHANALDEGSPPSRLASARGSHPQSFAAAAPPLAAAPACLRLPAPFRPPPDCESSLPAALGVSSWLRPQRARRLCAPLLARASAAGDVSKRQQNITPESRSTPCACRKHVLWACMHEGGALHFPSSLASHGTRRTQQLAHARTPAIQTQRLPHCDCLFPWRPPTAASIAS